MVNRLLEVMFQRGSYGALVRAKWYLTMFFYIYKVFWSFLYDFDLLNPNPLSASRKSLSNFVQTQKTKMAAKTREAIKIAVSAHVFGPHG